MGHMKDLLITIYAGGDDAVAAVERIGKDWREQLDHAANEIERLRITDSEREAVQQAFDFVCGMERPDEWAVATLRGLLERMTL